MAAPAEPTKKRSSLQLRIVSAAVLIPVAALAAYAGGAGWFLLVLVFGTAMISEWCLISSRARDPQNPQQRLPARLSPQLVFAILSVYAILVVSASSVDGPGFAGVVVFFVSFVLCLFPLPKPDWPRRLWPCLGIFYVGIPCAAFISLRGDPTVGLQQILWIVALVIAVDTGAYFSGRSIGGPKLAPHISPNKTWAGLIGGMVSAAIVGAITTAILGRPSIVPLTVVSAGLAIVEQAGDLAESAFKRHFGVKDASNIIPGHGGALDRVDGLIAVAAAVAGINALIGSSVLTWL